MYIYKYVGGKKQSLFFQVKGGDWRKNEFVIFLCFKEYINK